MATLTENSSSIYFYLFSILNYKTNQKGKQNQRKTSTHTHIDKRPRKTRTVTRMNNSSQSRSAFSYPYYSLNSSSIHFNYTGQKKLSSTCIFPINLIQKSQFCLSVTFYYRFKLSNKVFNKRIKDTSSLFASGMISVDRFSAEIHLFEYRSRFILYHFYSKLARKWVLIEISTLVEATEGFHL